MDMIGRLYRAVRDGVTREGAPGRLYEATRDDVDGGAFLDRSQKDPHQFRFVVSADEGARLADLKPFIRDLMAQMERDLDTGLDWVAVDHFNTGHPHTHIVIRGRDDQGKDLVMARDYIGHGVTMRNLRQAETERLVRDRHGISISRTAAPSQVCGFLVYTSARSPRRWARLLSSAGRIPSRWPNGSRHPCDLDARSWTRGCWADSDLWAPRGLNRPRPGPTARRSRAPEPRLPAFLWLAFGKLRRVSAHTGDGPMARSTIATSSVTTLSTRRSRDSPRGRAFVCLSEPPP